MDTSGYGHLPGLLVFGGPLDRSKVDHRILKMYDSDSPSHGEIFALPAHITFEETEGLVSPLTLTRIIQNGPNLKAWSGVGLTGETFALTGIISRSQLNLFSSLPGVKFIWLLEDRSRWTIPWHGVDE